MDGRLFMALSLVSARVLSISRVRTVTFRIDGTVTRTELQQAPHSALGSIKTATKGVGKTTIDMPPTPRQTDATGRECAAERALDQLFKSEVMADCNPNVSEKRFPCSSVNCEPHSHLYWDRARKSPEQRLDHTLLPYVTGSVNNRNDHDHNRN